MAEGRKLAFLVGVTEYEHEAFPALAAPADDVERLRRVLVEQGDFEAVVSLNDGYATIREKLLRAALKCGAEDLFLFYYSGHGVRDFSGRLYLTTAGSSPSALQVDSIVASELQGWLGDCKARRQILVLDCCYSAAFGDAFPAWKDGGGALVTGPELVPDNGTGHYVITATDKAQPAPAGDALSGSHFTALLIEGLQGEAAPGEPEISAQALADFVEREAPRRLGITPKRWVRNQNGPLRLVRNAALARHHVPQEVQEALVSPHPFERLGAAWRLGRMMRSDPAPLRRRSAELLLRARLADEGETHAFVRDALAEPLAPAETAPTLALEQAEAEAAASRATAATARQEAGELRARLAAADQAAATAAGLILEAEAAAGRRMRRVLVLGTFVAVLLISLSWVMTGRASDAERRLATASAELTDANGAERNAREEARHIADALKGAQADAARTKSETDRARAIVAAAALRSRVINHCDNCPDMVVLPAPNATATKPVMLFGAGPVTRAQFKLFVDETKRSMPNDCGRRWGSTPTPPLGWSNPGFTQLDTEPVVCVSWADAHEYAKWIGQKASRSYRLPRAEEWDAVVALFQATLPDWPAKSDCSAGNFMDRSFVDRQKSGKTWMTDLAFKEAKPLACSDGFPFTAPVGSSRFRTPWQISDLRGNTLQWLEDAGTKPGDYGFRGASWASGEDWTAPGGSYRGESRYNEIGFRLAADPTPDDY